MAAAAWDGQDQHMAPAAEDDFAQFLDMNGMGNMSAGLQFGLHGFPHGGSHHGGSHHGGSQPAMGQPRQHPDALMANSDSSAMVPPTSDGLLQHHAPAMASDVMAPQMMSTSAPNDPISNIDAQIHYLQQQKFQQQQRQLHEQRATFFSSHHHHSAPPPPQNLEMPPGSGQLYSQPDHMSRQVTYDRGYRQRVAEQQDVRVPDPWTCKDTIAHANHRPITPDGIHASRVPSCDSPGSAIQHGKRLYFPWDLL